MKYVEEKLVKLLMILSTLFVISPLIIIVLMAVIKGGGVLAENPGILFTAPGPKYLLGGEGGFLHAFLGSLYMVIPATLFAAFISCAIAIFMQSEYCPESYSYIIRIILDILWGTPSIIYGVFVLVILIYTNQRGCLLAGTAALTLLQIPIISRYVDEAVSSVPKEIKECSYSMGLTRLETSKIVFKYAISGISAGILMGFGRGLGDAATIIFTSGASNNIPHSVFDTATALPVLIFQQAGSFYPSVRNHAYAASLLLIIFILLINVISYYIKNRYSRYVKGE